jgi:hypothetical protein
VLGTIAESHTKSALAGGTASLQAVSDGYQLGFEIGALFCIAGALVAALLLRERPEPVAVTAPEPAEVEEAERIAA